MAKKAANNATRTSARSPRRNAKTAGPPAVPCPPALALEEIARRAREIWLGTGCLPGRDEENWHLAEAQLRQELIGT